ncbi:MAG: hypothetical protein JWR16_1081 [Nevskia sp.]|nr:hypothetical protein [Nevskia sp.]
MSDISDAEVEWMEKLNAARARLEIPGEVLERLRARGWVLARGDGSTVMTGAGRESLVRLRYKLPIPETNIDAEPETELEAESEEADLSDAALGDDEPVEER